MEDNATKALRPRVMFTLAGGGFLWEAIQLINGVSTEIEYLYVTTSDCMVPSFNEIPEGSVHAIERVTNLTETRTRVKVLGFLKCLFQGLRLLRRERPDMLVCLGTSISLPLCLAARLLNIRAIFIESVTRVQGLSTTGRLVQRFRLSDRLYVQWPEMANSEPGAVYRGTVL